MKARRFGVAAAAVSFFVAVAGEATGAVTLTKAAAWRAAPGVAGAFGGVVWRSTYTVTFGAADGPFNDVHVELKAAGAFDQYQAGLSNAGAQAANVVIGGTTYLSFATANPAGYASPLVIVYDFTSAQGRQQVLLTLNGTVAPPRPIAGAIPALPGFQPNEGDTVVAFAPGTFTPSSEVSLLTDPQADGTGALLAIGLAGSDGSATLPLPPRGKDDLAPGLRAGNLYIAQDRELAYQVVVPAPSAALWVGVLGLAAARRRRG